MKLTIQTKVTKKAARGFIRQMESQGYEAVESLYGKFSDVHFKLDGETCIDYSVTFQPGLAYIGVRPK